MAIYRLEMYIVYSSFSGEYVEFVADNGYAAARSAAIKMALAMLAEGPEGEPYQGIQLTAQVTDLREDEQKDFKILTGEKMHPSEILEALVVERTILEDSGYSFEDEDIPVKFKEKNHLILEKHWKNLVEFTRTISSED